MGWVCVGVDAVLSELDTSVSRIILSSSEPLASQVNGKCNREAQKHRGNLAGKAWGFGSVQVGVRLMGARPDPLMLQGHSRRPSLGSQVNG